MPLPLERALAFTLQQVTEWKWADCTAALCGLGLTGPKGNPPRGVRHEEDLMQDDCNRGERWANNDAGQGVWGYSQGAGEEAGVGEATQWRPLPPSLDPMVPRRPLTWEAA